MASAEADPLANSEEMGTNSNENDNFDVSMLSEQDIQLIKKMQMLKSMGLSQSRPHGRVVTNKSLPEILCTCPQKCDEKVPLKVRTYMFKYYHALMRDRPKQEMLLLRFIEMKSLTQRLKEDNKRVQCRYKAPTSMKAIEFIFQDGKCKDLCVWQCTHCIRPHSSLSIQCIEFSVQSSNQYESNRVHFSRCSQLLNAIDSDIELVNNFFYNQLWKPEIFDFKNGDKEEAEFKKPLNTMDSSLNTVMIAQDLAAGCKPLLQMLQNNQKIVEEEEHFDISSQLLNAIDSDIELVNNFFYNQLWKPEIFDFKNGEKEEAEFKKPLNTMDSSLNSTAKSNTMSASLLDETFDSVINASASMQDDTDANESTTINESTINESTMNDEKEEPSLNDTEDRDPLEKDPLDTPDTAEDLEVAAANASALASQSHLTNGSDVPLNLNIHANSPDSSSSRASPDSTVSRSSNPTSTSSSGHSAKYSDAGAAMDLSISTSSNRASSSSSSKSRPSQSNGRHRSEPMRQNSSKSSPSIQNILNNHNLLQNFPFPMMPPSAFFDPDLTKYLSGLESSISITPKMQNGRSRKRHSNGSSNATTAAALTAQLIQNALNQSSISVTATPSGSANIASKYNSMGGSHSLNQILNIPDSVSITPTLVDNSKS
ncbi:uncharacterized protein LOC103507454 [Diaphorina citri]|uniref:Uncharacterized protein LOC103507454 n=1 Tax=Diaphorina citri TaxID=121845 RepID=A0A3Q0IPE5_DIACI|nr:uncharacterized protein LOC103507454 [Diaphorina citri]